MTMVMFRGGAVLVGMTAALACTTQGTESVEGSTTIITVDDTGDASHECGGVLSHSHPTGDGGCICDAGYTWAEPEDPNDYECVPSGGMGACTEEHNVMTDGGCICEEPYDWCEPNDPNDFSCCGSSPPNPSTTNPGTSTEGSTTEPVDPDTTAGEDGPTPPDPDQCNEASEGAMFCSNTEAQGPQDSALWACTDGAWVDITDTTDEQCQFDNYDFAYGCIDDGSAIAFLCGNGTGAPCDENDVSMCIDAVEIDTCIWGRATQDSCEAICTTIGDEMGVMYDSGFCDTEAKVAECVCCDEGECP
jgi:hypothetical protein